MGALVSAARTRGLRASTGSGDASWGVAMAGGKKARAKLKSERLKNRSRAGNGSDPSPPEGVGSSDTPRSAVDEFLGGFSSTGASIETMMRDLMMAPTGTGNGDALADASDRAKGIDTGQLLDCLREGSSLPGVSRLLSIHVEGLRCLELETPAVRSAVQSHMIKNFNNPGNQRPEQLRAELFKLLAEVKAKPETVRVFEELVAGMDSSENQERDSAAMDVLENTDAAAEDDDGSSGPPSLAPSDDDDDDPRRSIQNSRADALECLKFETPAVRNAVVEHFQKTVDNIKVTPGNRRPHPPQLRAELFKLLVEVKAKPETVATFEAMIENAENQERERVAAMDVLENPNAVAEDDDGSSGPPSLAPSDDDDDDPRRSIRKEDEKNDSSAPPSLASSSGSDDDEDDRARTKVSDGNKNKTPLLPEDVPEKGKGRVPLDATPASDSSSQPPSLASSPESSPAASPRASRVPSEAHIAGASGSGTGPVDPEASPSEALNAFFDPGEAKKKEAAKKKKKRRRNGRAQKRTRRRSHAAFGSETGSGNRNETETKRERKAQALLRRGFARAQARARERGEGARDTLIDKRRRRRGVDERFPEPGFRTRYARGFARGAVCVLPRALRGERRRRRLALDPPASRASRARRAQRQARHRRVRIRVRDERRRRIRKRERRPLHLLGVALRHARASMRRRRDVPRVVDE